MIRDDDGLSAAANTPSLERVWLGPLADIAADLARGFDCGNCDGSFGTHNCVEDGCASLHDGIYEELSHIDRQLQQAVREREEYIGKHQIAVMHCDQLRAALAQIIQVCLDNDHVDGDGAKMALAFVSDVASRAGP